MVQEFLFIYDFISRHLERVQRIVQQQQLSFLLMSNEPSGEGMKNELK